jgi:APA family basic amino acid/polyamine antiporter
MYLAVMPLQGIAHAENDRVGVEAAKIIFGSEGTKIIAVMLMISTFGCNNGLILSGARVYYTMAKDGLFFQQVGKLNKMQCRPWVCGFNVCGPVYYASAVNMATCWII